MRSHIVKCLVLIPLGMTFSALSCGPRPEKVPTPDHIDLPSQATAVARQKAVWFATSNYTSGGTLARLDLETGSLISKVLDIASDVQIFQDGKDGLLMLTRMQQDAVTLLSGPQASVTTQISLAEGINPQGVARDSLNRIWLTSLDSNTVQIFSPDLSSQVGSIDLSVLKEEGSTDGFAELSQIIRLDSDRMAVSAQRLHRSVGYWEPDRQSGLASLNIHSLQVEYTGLIDAPNPNLLFAQPFPLTQDTQLWVIGAGDLFSAQGMTSRVSQFSNQTQVSVSSAAYPYRIISAHLSSADQPPALIAWYPEEKKSCIQLGELKLICDGSESNGGYVFNKLIRHENLLFVSYIAFRNSQLWIIPIDGTPVRKIDMPLPIESMSFGP